MSEPVLEVKHLSKNFGCVEALRETTFAIPKNKITAFLGENGAGKTTFIRLILGFLRGDSGTIRLNARRIGYVPERPAFFNWLTGWDTLFLTSRFFGLKEHENKDIIEKWSQKIDFDTQLLSRQVHTYSLGNQKKFSYLQSLIISPDFFIVDEPFNSLDPCSIKKVRNLFSEFREQGRTIFLSSHIISEIEKVADVFLIIKKGKIVAQGDLKYFRENFLLVCVEKKSEGKKIVSELASFFKETDSTCEGLVEKSHLASPERTEKQKGLAFQISEVDLETLFFFFAK